MSRFFSGNYGSALGDTRTAANLIAQAGATQGQMLANVGQNIGNTLNDLGGQIGKTLEKFRENKEKKETEQRAENLFIKQYESNPDHPIFKNFNINGIDEAKAVAKDLSKDPALVKSAMQLGQMAQQQEQMELVNALRRMQIGGAAQTMATNAMASDQVQNQQTGQNQFSNFQLQAPQNESPEAFRKRVQMARDSGNLNQQGANLAANSLMQMRGAEVKAKSEQLENLPKNETDLRKEFTALPEIKDFKQVYASYDKVKAAGTNPSAAGDISLIFNYMKILDPGSVVREGEFATAQNAGGVGDMIKNQYNRLLDGQRLNEKQRNDFLNQARLAANAQFNQVRDATEIYRGIIKENNLRENQVIPLKIVELEKDLMKEFKTPADKETAKDTMDESVNPNRLAATPAGSPTTKPSTNPQFDQLVQQVLQKAAAGESLTPDEQRVIDLLEKQKQQNQR